MGSEEATALVTRALAQSWGFTADKLAERLGLTCGVRDALSITTIGSVNVDKAGRTARRKAKDRERKRAKRAASGAKSRAEYVANSLSATRPWEALGISRRTWERRRRIAGRDIVGPVCDISGGFRDIDCHAETLTQVRPQQDTKYQLGADGLATRTKLSTVPGGALDGAPIHKPERIRAAAFLPARAGWTRQLATLLLPDTEAKGGQQADPFPIFPDTREGQNPPIGMATWVLPGEHGAGARPRETSAFNIFSQGGA